VTEKTPVAPRWGLVDAFAGGVLFLLLSSVAQLIARTPEVALQPGLSYAINQVLGGWLPFVVVVLVASYLRGRRSLSADFGLRFRLLDIAIGVLCGILLRFVALGLAELVRLVAGAPATPFTGGVGSDPVWFVLTAVVAASLITPVVEELYFRGLLLRSIRNAVLGQHDDGAVAARLKVPEGRRRLASVVAVAGSALLFMLFHLDGVPESPAAVSRLITLLVFGLVLGSLALLTRRLGPSILTHVVFNLSVAVLDIAAGASGPALG